MRNERLINKARSICFDYMENNNIDAMEWHQTINNRLCEWYDNTEITDAETLAAVALHCDFELSHDWKWVQAIKEEYFPTIPIEVGEIHISEIEEALFDRFR